MSAHEQLYSLASESEPDAADVLNECGDAAKALLVSLRNLVWQLDRLDCDLGEDTKLMIDDAKKAIAKATREG